MLACNIIHDTFEISASLVLALINEENPLINTTKAKAKEYNCSPKITE